MIDSMLYYMLLRFYDKHAKQKRKATTKRHSPKYKFHMLYYRGAFFEFPVVTSIMRYTGIRPTLFMLAKPVYTDRLYVETSLSMRYCAIYRCRTNSRLYVEKQSHICFAKTCVLLLLWVHFQSNCIDCSPRETVYTRKHSMQTYILFEFKNI